MRKKHYLCKIMIPYNTDQEPLLLPEFGRTIQKMVDYCVGIEDRDERNHCAYSIADMMAGCHPDLVGEDGDMRRIWDAMNIMSRFELDVDFPCEVVSQEKMHPVPERIPYGNSNIRLRYYGKNIERMISYVADMEPGEERDELISMIAHHLKKLQLQHNKEGVDDAKILRDLAMYSGGKIDLDPEQYILHEYREIPEPKQQNKKRKKNRNA